MNTNDPHGISRPWAVMSASLLVLLAPAITVALQGCGGEAAGAIDPTLIPTVPVRRGDLTVTVTKGGTLQATESLDIKSEVDGSHQILELIPEGTIITEEDVEKGRVLVRIDVAELEDREGNQEIAFRNAEAAYTQAQENLDIQKKDNESNIAAAALKLKFAYMELERYVGKTLAAEILEKAGKVDFSRVIEGREHMAVQVMLDLAAKEADVQLAEEELKRAQEKLLSTQRLKAKNFVSKTELEADQLAETRKRIALQRAKDELELFKVYTLPKEAEKRYSDCVEAQRDLDKVKVRARSQLTQVEAQLESHRVAYERQKEQLEKTREMIANGTIRATRPGLVVYASTSDPWRHRQNPIQEGTNVQRNMSILTIPDLQTLAARVDIHETDIASIELGQKAHVTVEALPGKVFRGKVVRRAPMATSEGWRGGGIRVYKTDVAVDVKNLPEGVKLTQLTPGMSATAEIVVAELKSVLHVPIQAVTTYRGDRICWVKTPQGPERRVVSIGQFTGRFIVITEGLKEGEEVYLAPVEVLKESEEDQEEPAAQEEPKREENAGPDQKEGEQENVAAAGGEFDLANIRKELAAMTAEERREKIRQLLEQFPDQSDKLRGLTRGLGARGSGRPPGGGRSGGGRPAGRPSR